MKQCPVCKHEYKRPDDSQADGHKDEEYIPQPRTWSLTDEQVVAIKRILTCLLEDERIEYLEEELGYKHLFDSIYLMENWLQDSGANDL
jgi:hypothetical protein